jgi:PAS domain S-box-containing protein
MRRALGKRIWFLTGVIVLLIICGFVLNYFYQVERNRKVAEIVSHQKIHARLASTNVKALFENYSSELQYLSQDENVIRMNENGKYELGKLFEILKGEIKSITRVDKTGKIIYTTPYYPNSIGKNISKQNHMVLILANHKPVVSDVFMAVQGFQAVAIHYPVYYKGEFAGTIAFVLNFRDILNKVLDQIASGKNGFAWMLSKDGIELYSPAANYSGNSLKTITKRVPGLLKLGNKMISGEEGVTTYSYAYNLDESDKYKMIAYYLPVKILNTYWSLAVIASQKDITYSLTNLRNKLIFLAAAIFLGGVFISYFGIKAWLIVKNAVASRKAQEKLEESEELLRTFIQQSTDGYFIVDEHGIIREWNLGMETITGVHKIEAINESWFDVMTQVMIPEYKTKENLESYKNVMDGILKARNIDDKFKLIDTFVQRRDGEIISVHQNLFPILANNVFRIGCITKDVTQQKKIEKDLEEDRLLLLTLIENLPSAVFVKDKNYRKVIANKQHLESVVGQLLKLGENADVCITGKTDYEVYPKELADEYYIDDKSVIEDGNSIINKEEFGYNPSGEMVWLLVSKIPLFNNEGKASGMVGITTDITSLKKSEEALRKSQEHFSRIMNTVDEVVYSICGQTGEFEYLSPAFEKKLGYSLDDINKMGGRWAFITSVIVDSEVSMDDPVTSILNKSVVNNTIVWEHWCRCKNGTLLFLEDISVPIYDGTILSRVDGVLRDVTERKKAELEIVKAKEHAEEVNRLKSNFLANMSHELRTPLVGMLGFSELLFDEIEGPEKEYARMINISSHRLLRTLNTLLNYSKIDSENIQIYPRLVSLKAIIREEINLFLAMANQNGLYIQEEWNCSDLEITTDERMLKEIIDNLLNNAIRFTKQGGVTVLVSVKEPGFEIKIADTGIGISKDNLQVIFEDFRQASEGMGRNFEGTGLGLTIVKKYTEAMGGTITVESELNEGATFIVSLPINLELKEVDGQIQQVKLSAKDVVENKVDESSSKQKLLLVEDDTINSLAISSMLCKNYSVTAVTNADDAIIHANRIQFDLILLDINLKNEKNGVFAAQEILQIDGYAQTPIVAMTAYASSQDQKEFLSSGFSHYLSKPFTQDSLLSFVESILIKNSPTY